MCQAAWQSAVNVPLLQIGEEFVVRASALEDALKRALRTARSFLPLEGGGEEERLG